MIGKQHSKATRFLLLLSALLLLGTQGALSGAQSRMKEFLQHLDEGERPSPEDIETLARSLQGQGALNQADEKGHTLLHKIALYLRTLEYRLLMESLLELGCDPSLRDVEGNTVLHTIMVGPLTGNQVAWVRYLLGHKSVDPNAVNKEGNTPLLRLLLNDGQVVPTALIVRELIKAGASVRKANSQQQSPIGLVKKEAVTQERLTKKIKEADAQEEKLAQRLNLKKSLSLSAVVFCFVLAVLWWPGPSLPEEEEAFLQVDEPRQADKPSEKGLPEFVEDGNDPIAL